MKGSVRRLRDAVHARRGEFNILDADDVALSAAVGEEPRTAKLVGDVKEIVTTAASPSHKLGPRMAVAGSVFAGADTCRGCHPAEFAQWSSTAHAKAWATLVTERRQLDHDCFGCHATGVDAPGGPTLPGEVAGLRDVQCEACHGPSREHMRSPATVKPPVADPPQKACTGCHDGDQDGGRFDFGTYRPRVVHGGTPEAP